jgi:predicted peroxiredoxin
MKQEQVQIVISCGPENAARAVLGFSLAAAAVSVGTGVSLFLIMNGARWALQSEGNSTQMPGFQSIGSLIQAIQAGGGTIEVCANCAPDGACSLPRGEEMRPGIVRSGLAAVAIRLSQVPTVAF